MHNSPLTYAYQNISTPAAQFNTYSMSFASRLFLMDLDLNGVGPLTQANPTACTPLIPEAAFVSMVRPLRSNTLFPLATHAGPRGRAAA
jgi:hypothetical protein